jgi:hypothetical protein
MMPFSCIIVTSLCYYKVAHYIHVVAIFRYGWNPNLNIVIKKLSIVSLAKFIECS